MATNKTSIILTADDRTRAAFTSAKANMQGLQQVGVQLRGVLAGIGLGVGASAAGLLAFVKTSIDAADALNDLSVRTGLSVEALNGLQYAAKLGDTNMEALGAGVGRLNKAIGEAAAGNDKMADTLSALGITAKDPEQALYQLADAVAAMPDPTRRAAELSKLLGKSYQELLPLLEGGGAAMQALADEGRRLNPITAQMAEQAGRFNDQLDTLKTQASGAGTVLANSLLPALNAIATGFNNAAQSKASFLGGAALGVNIFNPVGQQLKDLREEIKDLEGQQETAVGLGFGRYKSIDNKIAQAKELKKALEEVQSAEALKLLDDVLKSGSQPPSKNALGEHPAAALKSAATPKLDTIDPFGAARIAAELAARNELIARANEEAAEEFRLFSGPAFDAETRALDEFKARLESLVSNTTLIKTEKLQSDVDFLNTAFFEGAIGVQQYEEAIAQLTGTASKELQKAKTEFDLFAEEALKGFQDGLADYLFDPFQDGLDGMLKGFGVMLQRMAAEAAAANITRSIFGTGQSSAAGGQNLAGTIASFFGFADGGAPGGVSAWRNQVVSQPTFFKFAKGGVMGEAGPEAIMPLSRGPDGRLGVQAQGGGGVVVNIIESPGNGGTQNQRQEGGRQIIDVMVEAVTARVAGQITSGRGSVPAALAGTYGLNRAAGAR